MDSLAGEKNAPLKYQNLDSEVIHRTYVLAVASFSAVWILVTDTLKKRLHLQNKGRD